jgi:hypothetical protein
MEKPKTILPWDSTKVYGKGDEATYEGGVLVSDCDHNQCIPPYTPEKWHEKPVFRSRSRSPNISDRERFPMASESMLPVQDFCIGGRWLSMYEVTGRTPSCPFSLYWDDTREPTGNALDDRRPLQHAMGYSEVLVVLFQLLEKVEEERIGRLLGFKFEQR